jgi:Ca2+-transporting ATPase
MLKRRALIRQLPAVETLGSVNVICSDKTGTLTENRMAVAALDIANRRIDFAHQPGRAILPHDPTYESLLGKGIEPTIDLLLIAGALCNDAVLHPNEGEPRSYRAIGDPTEGALLLAAARIGILQDSLDRTLPRVGELPFDSVRKRMTTVHRMPRSRAEVPPPLLPVWEPSARAGVDPPFLAATKGAIDGLLDITAAVCIEGRTEPVDDVWRTRIMAAHDELASEGMRILGIGLRPLDRMPEPSDLANLERNLILVGLVGMLDPPRPEARDAVRLCRAAGIRPVMITGDHPFTALHVAHEVGISEDDRFATGQELEQLSEEQLRRTTTEVSVFARVSPEHKIRLVAAYQSRGHVVAMTGDGVNDAPALKKADIGVAMGITGTDVSKDAAKMVLLDDNFATIVAAVQEGRVVYDNIRRFIKYLLTCNASEIAVMLLGPLLGMPLPLQPLQILWMNLVTDGLPALALSVEPAEANVMRRPPRAAAHGIFGRGMVPFIVVMAMVASLASIGVGLFAFRNGDAQWQTLLFTTLIFSQLALALGVRSETGSLRSIGLRSNRAMIGAVLVTVVLQICVLYVPFLQEIFGTMPLPPGDLLVAALAGGAVLVAVEAWKWVLRAHGETRTLSQSV